MIFFETNIHLKKKRGSIEVICGSMFSGKTEELIRRLRRTQFAHQNLLIYKPEREIKLFLAEIEILNPDVIFFKVINNRAVQF